MIARLLMGTARFAGGVALWIVKRVAFSVALVLVVGMMGKCAHAALVVV